MTNKCAGRRVRKTQKCVTRQQRTGEQSRISAWPDGNVLRSIKWRMLDKREKGN